jgi:cytochrome c peroxidase
MMSRISIASILCLILFVQMMDSCSKKDTLGAATPVQFQAPPGFPPVRYDFQQHPVTEQGVALGRKLFYDGQLSKDGNFPCASCHQQFAAFATFDHDFSHGFDNQFTTRNAPGLFNLAWTNQLHWDGGINHLEVQPLAPITAPNEMAETMANVVKKLQADNRYPPMFAAAFGSPEINNQRVLQAMAQFMIMMVSADSKYDRVKRGQAQFNSLEAQGYEIFKAKCNSCHREPLFTDDSFRNIGLTLHPTLRDMGRMRVTGNSSDSLKFKVPSLRNVALTFPYMHDGRFYTIGQVLDHYQAGVVPSATVDPLVRNRIPLSNNEKTLLQSFLRALTDSSFITDKKLAQPQ